MTSLFCSLRIPRRLDLPRPFSGQCPHLTESTGFLLKDPQSIRPEVLHDLRRIGFSHSGHETAPQVAADYHARRRQASRERKPSTINCRPYSRCICHRPERSSVSPHSTPGRRPLIETISPSLLHPKFTNAKSRFFILKKTTRSRTPVMRFSPPHWVAQHSWSPEGRIAVASARPYVTGKQGPSSIPKTACASSVKSVNTPTASVCRSSSTLCEPVATA